MNKSLASIFLVLTFFPGSFNLALAQSQDVALSKGSQGEEVKVLQRFLIGESYLRQGLDTGYFGSLTESALRKFQTDHSISVNGILDRATYEKMKEVAQMNQSQGSGTVPKSNMSTSTSQNSVNTSGGLLKGNSGEAVKVLQRALISLKLLASGLDTGYFGQLTENALKKFQAENNLTASGKYDFATHSKLKEVLQR